MRIGMVVWSLIYVVDGLSLSTVCVCATAEVGSVGV
jgi:hypothetical protein